MKTAFAIINVKTPTDSGFEHIWKGELSPNQWTWISMILSKGCRPTSWEVSLGPGIQPCTVQDSTVAGREAEYDLLHEEDIGVKVQGNKRVWKYHCKLCKSNFNSKDSLRQHSKDKHEVRL